MEKDYKKLYEDALETAKAYYKQNKGVVDGVECLSIIFPELRETNDDRIRKALIQHIKDKVSVILGWRKEEREKASIEYQMSILPVAIGGAAFAEDVEQMNINPSFVAGAQWADKTMIEKACEWLLNNINYYIIIDKTKFGVDWPKVKAELFDDFKKAMEE